MVSTIMKFLDTGPSKATDGTLKARVLASEPDNAEGIHNFAPLGKLDTPTVWYDFETYRFRRIECVGRFGGNSDFAK